MKKQVLFDIFESIAPLSLSEEWDNCGTQIDLGKTEINKVYVALEITEDVIRAAADCGADMIITHHPMLLPSFELSSVSESDVIGRQTIELIKNGIEVCSLHTCYDAAPGGMNDQLCSMLNLQDVRVLAGNILRIGRLPEPVPFSEFEKLTADVLDHPLGAKSIGNKDKIIRTVAVCTGSGGDLWKQAADAGADVYVTGEVKHHEAGYIKQTDMCCIAAGHSGTEWIFVPCFSCRLEMESVGRLEIIQCPDHQEPFDRLI